MKTKVKNTKWLGGTKMKKEVIEMKRIAVILALLFGCGESIKKESFKIGKEGGVIQKEELKILIPEHALDKEVEIKISKVSKVPHGNTGPAFKIEPDIYFKKPVEISIKGKAKSIVYLDEKWNTWVHVPSYLKDGDLWAKTIHLST